jgi:hypothetical protein
MDPFEVGRDERDESNKSVLLCLKGTTAYETSAPGNRQVNVWHIPGLVIEAGPMFSIAEQLIIACDANTISVSRSECGIAIVQAEFVASSVETVTKICRAYNLPRIVSRTKHIENTSLVPYFPKNSLGRRYPLLFVASKRGN